ncbi:MAG: hypothetical protein U1F33_17985 [Alphaproteobacteria bacterium]
MRTVLTALAVVASLATPPLASAAPIAAARAAAGISPDALLERAGGKGSIQKQCERNADYHKLTGLQREAHIENCKKTLGSMEKKGAGQP